MWPIRLMRTTLCWEFYVCTTTKKASSENKDEKSGDGTTFCTSFRLGFGQPAAKPVDVEEKR